MLTFQEPSIGELRYIARLNADLLPNEEPFGDVSNIDGGTAIEGSDVVSIQFHLTWIKAYKKQYLVDGETRSKFYSSERFIDDQRHCQYAHLRPRQYSNQDIGVSGSAHRVCMIIPQYETSAGGPFHR